MQRPLGLMQTPIVPLSTVFCCCLEPWSVESGARSLELLAVKRLLCFAMAGWMDLEISFWLVVAIGLGLVLLVGRKVRNEDYQ